MRADKSTFCTFTRTRIQLPNTFKLGDMTIAYKNTVRYLGMFLDRKLIWKDHIQYIIKRTEQGLNLMRVFSNQFWGADPNICLLFYRMYIRSILDYGSTLYGTAAKIHLMKIDRIKNKCLRQSMGLLQSTPIDILESEAVEPPLNIRRNFLSDKFLIKLISKQSDLINQVNQLTILAYTHPYWRTKKLPPLVESYSWITQIKETMYSSKVIPYFQLDYCMIQRSPQVIIKNDSGKDPHVVKNNFLEELRTKWSSYEHVFTDGSVLNGKTACAFYHKNNKVSKSIKLPDGTSIFSAELWAIVESLKYCFEFVGNSLFVIFSDSKSSLESLSNFRTNSPSNHIIKTIIHLVQILENSNKTIKFVWIKAHIGIPYNEIVDKLAKDATMILNPIKHFKIPYNDVIIQAKERAIKQWQKMYNESPTGLNYKCNFPKIQHRPWFFYETNRHFIRTITRLRSNHALCPKYKKKIGLAENENCECGEVGDIEHIILNCQRNINKTYNFVTKIPKIEGPFNLNNLISLSNRNIYKILYQALTKMNIRL